MIGVVVYWDDISRVYGENYYEETAVWHIDKVVREHLHVDICYDEILKWDMERKFVYKKVVNYGRNQHRLENIVHRHYLDLAEVYYLKISVSEKESGTSEVTEGLLRYWGISEEELNEQAEENMSQEGYHYCTIQEMLADYGVTALSEEVYLYVITNQKKFFGSGILTNPALLKEVLGELNRDYFILPSSIHELLLCPDDGRLDADGLKGLVHEVNCLAVKEGDFLSDNVYYYHADAGIIEICGENPK